VSVDKTQSEPGFGSFSRRGRAIPKYWLVRDHSSEGNHAWLVGLWLASPRVAYFQPQSNDRFRQPAASRIDDVSHPCVGVKASAQIGPAWTTQVSSPGCLSQANRGFGPRDSKIYSPGSSVANEPRLGRPGIEKLSATASDPAFRNSILPRACRACARGFHATGCKQLGDLLAKLAITIKNRIAVRTRLRKRFPQLLHYPGAIRVFRDIEMEDPAAGVFDDEKQYKTRNVRVGTVKKSVAVMTSRWLRRKAHQRLRASSGGDRRRR
jgi:hypothetical protein